MRSIKSISATNLAVYQHLECELYIHKVYNTPTFTDPTRSTTTKNSERVNSQFKRGNDWEVMLYSWLERSQLLRRVSSIPLEPVSFLKNIMADNRDHFFITGVVFHPPQSRLDERFTDKGTDPIQFGTAKPDLIEITKNENEIRWRVIDAKASRHVKSSHYVQLYFYSMCLGYILERPPYKNTDTVAVWLPPNKGSVPSVENINVIPTSLLSPLLDKLLFSDLSKVIAYPEEDVEWHYNPLCRTCPFNKECKSRAQDQGALGSIPNISLDDAKVLRQLLQLSGVRHESPTSDQLTDIEDLHRVVNSPATLHRVSISSPTYVKRAKRLLAIEAKTSSERDTQASPVVDAARSGKIQIIQRRNFTCPSREDVAIIITILNDPLSSPSSDYFCVTTHSGSDNNHLPTKLPTISCSAKSIISELASLIRSIHKFQSEAAISSTSQFYVWSLEEYATLEGHIINAALNSSSNDHDIRLCISALTQGTSLLQTTFQPLILSGALLSFLASEDRTPSEYRTCLERLGLATEGPIKSLRERIRNEVTRLQESPSSSNRKEIGQLPLVVVLKQEIERQIALPVPGYWDLFECSTSLLTENVCPTDDQILAAHKNPLHPDTLTSLLIHRNDTIYYLLNDLRQRALTPSGKTLLINVAKPISTNLTALCEEPTIRKLFFMQQFEVISNLKELWKSRINGCPDSPVLQYERTLYDSSGTRHVFRIIYGSIDTASFDKSTTFYDQLLVPDLIHPVNGDNEAADIPLEALFDDLSVSGLVFPPNSYANNKWLRQEPRIKSELYIADVQQLHTNGSDFTTINLRVWGSVKFCPKPGARYRLSPRFVDFNTVKILSSLIDIDLRWSSRRRTSGVDGHYDIPFLQLITDPVSLSHTSTAKIFLSLEENVQKLFRNLKELGNDKAGSLILKPSQHRAAKHVLSNRLTTIWGPPGTGKTHTLCLSLLRLLEVEYRHEGRQDRIIFITAATHAAIEACQRKLIDLINTYKSIDWLPKEWLTDITVEVISRGNNHAAPIHGSSRVYIYAGTLYNFSKKNNIEVDCVVIDEAGQLLLVSIALVLRRLRDTGRIIVAGDSQQLAPILKARYPLVKPTSLFGSVIDCLMSSEASQGSGIKRDADPDAASRRNPIEVVQLTENFRLNPDIGELVSTIYSKEFKAQKTRVLQFATAVTTIRISETPPGINPNTFEATRQFLSALSNVISERHQQHLVAPTVKIPASIYHSVLTADATNTQRPISLTLIKITNTPSMNPYPYESQVRREADIASSLILFLQQCSPHNSVFVATPHRIQRDAVRSALTRAFVNDNERTSTSDNSIKERTDLKNVTIDTIERLQGSEADFVICLFSSLQVSPQDTIFLLERRRLNVAISRTKTLCILIASDDLLLPSVNTLSNADALKGYMFLKAYEGRAWTYMFPVDDSNT